MTSKPPGAGALFRHDAHRAFMTITGQRYDRMVARIEAKKLPALDFTKDQFRQHVLKTLGGHEDGAIICCYCNRPITLEDCAADHLIPLSRGGDTGLSNIGFPCSEDNDRKGGLTPAEYVSLLRFLDQTHPLARQDVLKRLQQSSKLLATTRRNAVLIREVKDSGHWPSKKKKQESRQNQGMGEF